MATWQPSSDSKKRQPMNDAGASRRYPLRHGGSPRVHNQPGQAAEDMLPGDSLVTIAALHALTAKELLPGNCVDPQARTAPCPRCGRATAATRAQVTVCTGCRASRIGQSGG